MKSSLLFLTRTTLLLCLSLLALVAFADDKKIDPTGTWTWTVTTQNGDSRETTLKLKFEGEKLSGMISGRNAETAIQEATLKGDAISFQVVRERDGNKFTQNYNGTISGDSIKGKMEFGRDGQARSREWVAKRQGAPAKAAASVNGKWKYSFTTSGGQTLEPVLELKQDGEKLTGMVKVNDRESAISDGKITGSEISFKVLRERDGQTFTSKYAAKFDGEVIKGKINSNFGGNDRTYDFEAKRWKE